MTTRVSSAAGGTIGTKLTREPLPWLEGSSTM
jgi:hypothetical protein